MRSLKVFVGFVLPLICLPLSGKAQTIVLGTPMLSAAVGTSSATTTTVVAGAVGKVINVYHWDFLVGATTNTVTWEYGTTTSTPCDTGTTTLTGGYVFGANGGMSVGNGEGNIWTLPGSASLCVVTTSASASAGSVSYRIH